MSRPMSMNELQELLEHIYKNNSPLSCPNGGRRVKYVDPKIDMRDFKCFAITFRGGFDETTLHTQNECANLEDSLFIKAMKWLNNKEAQPATKAGEST